jgi:glycosyltransferase involved in cell wall biosynthesis
MNKGIKMATGDIIGILNSDDYLSDRETIAQIVSTFLRDDCDAVYGNLIYVNKEDPYKIQRIWEAGSYSKRQLLHGWMLPHPTLYLKKNMYEKYGLYKSDFKYSADYEMIVRLLLKFTIKASNLKKVIVYMRAGGASNKNIFARLAVNNEDRQAWDSLGIQPKWYTLYMKPMRKIIQYFHKYFSVKWLIHIPPAYNEDSYLWTVV